MAKNDTEGEIYIYDTYSLSFGAGLFVVKAAEMIKEGKSIEEVRSWLEDNKLKLAHWFTVDDLFYLYEEN